MCFASSVNCTVPQRPCAMKIGGFSLPALRWTKGEGLRGGGFSKMAAKAAIGGAWRRVALGSGRPYTCPISEHSRSANASVPPDIKEAILRADRRPLQHTSPNQREGFDCSRHELST